MWETLKERVLSVCGQRTQKYLNSTHNLTKSLKQRVKDSIQSNLLAVEGRKESGSLLWLWHIAEMQGILGSGAVVETALFPYARQA